MMQTVIEQKNSLLSCYDNIFNEVGIETWAHKTKIIIKLKTTIILVNEPSNVKIELFPTVFILTSNPTGTSPFQQVVFNYKCCKKSFF